MQNFTKKRLTDLLPLHVLWHSNDSSWTESQRHGFDSSIWFLHQKLSANQIVVFQSDSQSANQIPTASQCSDLNAWLEEFYSKIKVGKQENNNRFSNLTKTLYSTIWKSMNFDVQKGTIFEYFYFFVNIISALESQHFISHARWPLSICFPPQISTLLCNTNLWRKSKTDSSQQKLK